MKNISISTHSINWSFNSNNNAVKHKSMSIGSYKHVTRTADTVQQVIRATNSNIDPSLTKYNVNLVKNGYNNFKKGQALISDRLEKRAQGGPIWTHNQEKELVVARKKVRSTRRSYTRALANKKADDKYKLSKKAAWESAKAKVDDLTKLKQGGGSKSYKKWATNTGVGGFTTLSMSAEMLYRLGWQFKKIVYGQPIEPYSIKEQLDFEKQHPKIKAVNGVKGAYSAMVDTIKDHPSRYGTLLTAAIHFDESSPHCDLITLDLGVGLDGKSVGHVGKKDNGTGDDLLNVRHRTYMNGTNSIEGIHGRDESYVEKYQDTFAKDTRQILLKQPANENTTEQELINIGFVRGVSKRKAKQKRHERMQILKAKYKNVTGNIDNQLNLAQKMASEANDTSSLAVADSRSASVARSSALKSAISSLNDSFSSSYAIFESKLKQSYSNQATKLSNNYSLAHSVLNSSASSMAINAGKLQSIQTDFLASSVVYSSGVISNRQKSTENARLSDSLVAKEQELLLREKEQKITDKMVNKVLHAYYDPTINKDGSKDKLIDDYSYGHKTNNKGQTGLEIVFLCVGQAIKKGMESFIHAFSELFGESETQIKNVRLRRMQNLENNNQSDSKNGKSNDEPTLD